MSFMIFSNSGDQVCEYISGKELTFSVLESNFYYQVATVFGRYPKQRKRIIQEILKNSDTVDPRTIKNCLPLLTADETNILFNSEYTPRFLDNLVRNQELNAHINRTYPVLSAMISSRTSRPLRFSVSTTNNNEQMDLDTPVNSKKRSYPD
jgi:hypothetical protein